MINVMSLVAIWFDALIASAAVLFSRHVLARRRPRVASLRLEPRVSRGTRAALIVAAMVAFAGVGPSATADDVSPVQIMEKNFIVSKVAGSTQDASVELLNSQGQRRVRTTYTAAKLQSNGTDYSRMVRYLEPSDVRGTATLLVEHAASNDDIWVYLPALKKTRRLVASNKKDSFVGTDFSYADVIGHRVNDWQHRIVGDENVDGAACYVIESLPKNDDVKATSGYSKRKSWIRKDNFVMVKAETWDLADQPFKSMHFSDVRLVDQAHGKWQAMISEATNTQTGHKTILRFSNFKLDPGISDDVFTTRALEQEP